MNLSSNPSEQFTGKPLQPKPMNADTIKELANTVKQIGDAEYLRGFRDGYDKAMRDVNENGTFNLGERLVKARTSDEFSRS